MDGRIRVGLVGIGDAGRHHARALAALDAEGALRWSAACARDLGRVERALAEWAPPHVAALADLDSLFDVCDALILATPDGLHADQVITCAERGLHVLVEKPLASTLDEARRALSATRASNVVLAVGYQLRHHAGHRLVAERLGELCGPLHRVSVRWAWPDPSTEGWRARGEQARFWSLAALGTHCIDLALWLSGEELDEVAALRSPPQGIDRAAEVSLRLGDVMAHVSVSVTHRAISRLVLTGELGELECVGTLGARGDGQILHRAPREDPRPLPFEPVDPYLAQLRAFIARALARETSDPAHALTNIDVLERIASLGRSR